MTQLAPVASLLDVDDSLLDSDGIVTNLKRYSTRVFPTAREERCCNCPIRPEAREPRQKMR